MSQSFIGQLLLVPYNFAPAGWAMCDGSLLSIADNSALFSLIGTTYGGDGQTTFALPDLRGRVALHQGTLQNGGSYTLGDKGGVENVTLSLQQIPVHTHPINVAGIAGNSQHPSGALLGDGSPVYHSGSANVALAATTMAAQGGNQPHSNQQPFLTLGWVICLEGIYPSS